MVNYNNTLVGLRHPIIEPTARFSSGSMRCDYDDRHHTGIAKSEVEDIGPMMLF